MSEKLIIDNRTELQMSTALRFVAKVVEDGYVSSFGKQYCYATIFVYADDEYLVTSHLNKSSQRLRIDKA